MTQPDLARLEGLLAIAAEDGFTPEIEQQLMDELPALLARVRELREALEEVETFASRGHPLMDGFQHGPRARKAMESDMLSIAAIARAALNLNRRNPDADR